MGFEPIDERLEVVLGDLVEDAGAEGNAEARRR